MTQLDPSPARSATHQIERPPATNPRDTLDLPVVAASPAGPWTPARQQRRSLAVAWLLLAAAVAGVATGALLGQPGPTSAVASQPAESEAAVIKPASVVGFDPAGGSGFRQDGATWRTQTYRSAQFGNLKSGVGLVLDLGEAREVSSVTLEASAGAAVELRASDAAPGAIEDFEKVDAADAAAGTTTLSGKDAGAHRYWMLWVPRLAPSDGGFSAQISNPVVTG
jgi:eukaryotic-like serine/threonine-protein kinase